MSRNNHKQDESSIPTDYSIKKNQVGCGYCAKEKYCIKRDPGINKAKQGCPEWKHWED